MTAVAKQKQLDGMQDAKNEKLSKLALAYAEVRDRRIKLNKEEAEKKTILLHEMKSAELDRYEDRDADVLVILEEKENVRVSKPSAAEENDD